MEMNKCCCLVFPTLSKKYWYFAWFLIGSFLRTSVPYFLGLIKYKYTTENDYEKNNFKQLITTMYFETIRNIASDLLCGIFHCIYTIRNRDKKIQAKPRATNEISFIFNDETNKNSQMRKLIFIISFIDIICQILLPIKYMVERLLNNEDFKIISSDHLNSFLFIDILSRYLFSLLILNTYFYAHHYFAFFLNFISLSTLVIIDYKYKINKYDILYIVIIGIKTILYSLEDIMNKVAFNTLYILPITLIYYKGLFQSVVYLPIITILFFSFKLYNFDDFSFRKEVQLFVTFVPFNIIRTIYLVDVIDRFTAQHMSFLKVSEALILFIFYLAIGEENRIFEIKLNQKINLDNIWSYGAYITQILAFIILLFSTLIHNEIIIVNVKKLKEKTEFFLGQDAHREQDSSFFSDALFSNSMNSNDSSINSDMSRSDTS